MKIPTMCPIGVRRHRVRVYTYSDTGSDGFVNEVYNFAAEYWASFRPQIAPVRETTVAAAAQHQREVVFGFDESVTISEHSVIKLEGQTYRVTGVPDPLTHTDNHTREVHAIWVDQEQFNLVD